MVLLSVAFGICLKRFSLVINTKGQTNLRFVHELIQYSQVLLHRLVIVIQYLKPTSFHEIPQKFTVPSVGQFCLIVSYQVLQEQTGLFSSNSFLQVQQPEVVEVLRYGADHRCRAEPSIDKQ